MDENLQHKLDDGEKLLLTSKPESFKAKDKTHAKSFTTGLIIALVIAAGLTVGYFALVGAQMVKPVLIIIIWVCALYAAFAEMLGCPKVRKTVYCLTDKRVLLDTEGEFHEFAYSQVEDFEFKNDDDGHTSLLVGKTALKKAPSKWRQLPIEPVLTEDATNAVAKAGLYAIEDPEKFRRIFAEQVSKAKALKAAK